LLGEKPKNLLGKGKGIAGGKTEKNLWGKPVSIYNEVNTLWCGPT